MDIEKRETENNPSTVKQSRINVNFYIACMVIYFCYILLALARNIKHNRYSFPYFFNPGDRTALEWVNSFWYLFDAALTLVFAVFLLKFFLEYFKKRSSQRFLSYTLNLLFVDMFIDEVIFVITNIVVMKDLLPNGSSDEIAEYNRIILTPANILSLISLVLLFILLLNFKNEKGRRFLNITMILLMTSILCGMIAAVYTDSLSYIARIKAGEMSVFKYIKRMVIDFGLGFGASILPGLLLIFNSSRDYKEYK